MKASRLIATLQEIIDQHGDIPCLVEVPVEVETGIGMFTETQMKDLGEVSVETREGFGVSAAMIW